MGGRTGAACGLVRLGGVVGAEYPLSPVRMHRVVGGLAEGQAGLRKETETMDDPAKELLPGIATAEVKDDPTHRRAHASGHLQQFRADGVNLGVGQLGAAQRRPPQGLDQHVGRRR